MATVAHRQGFWSRFDERLGLALLDYPVPRYANSIFYSLGGLTLLGFVVLAATGILMSQYYIPTPEAANESVRSLTASSWGAFVRSVHFWTAQVFAVTLGLHVARVVFTGSYKRPREINWYVGVALFLAAVGLLFTGTVLKWDQEGYEALSHARAGAAVAGAVGSILLPSLASSTTLLARFFSLHTSVLPLILVALLSLHLLLVKAHGISPLPWRGPAGWSVPSTFRKHLRHLLFLGLILYGVAAVMALVAPAPLGELPIEGVEITKPPWFFWPLYALENAFGIEGLVWSGAALVIGLIFLPPLDRGEERRPACRWGVTALLAIVVLFALGAVVYVGFTPQVSHVM